jgi:hypothetical protein
MIGVGGKAEQHLVDLLRVVRKMFAVSAKKVQVILALDSTCVKFFSVHPQYGGDIAVPASVATASVWVGSEGGIL